MNLIADFFYAAVLGFFSQNLSFEMGVCTGNLFKLSADKSVRRRYYFVIMLITTMLATAVTYVTDAYIISYFVTDTVTGDCIRGFVFVAVIAVIEICFELLLSWSAPNVRKMLGGYLPSACMNSGVLAILLLNRQFEYGLYQSMLFSFMAVMGFVVSVLLMQLLRERVILVRCPETMKGTPLALLATAILSLAFAGLTDMTFPY